MKVIHINRINIGQIKYKFLLKLKNILMLGKILNIYRSPPSFAREKLSVPKGCKFSILIEKEYKYKKKFCILVRYVIVFNGALIIIVDSLNINFLYLTNSLAANNHQNEQTHTLNQELQHTLKQSF